MQPTKIQVQRSLDALALESADRPDTPAARSNLSTSATDDGTDDVRVAHQLPDGVLELIEQTPSLRPDRLDRARALLARGELSADELADRIVGRLVCDRLR